MLAVHVVFSTAILGIQFHSCLTLCGPRGSHSAGIDCRQHPFSWSLSSTNSNSSGNANSNNGGSSEAPINMTFAQMQQRNACYCCGKRDHKLTDCPEKATKPRAQWFLHQNKDYKKIQSYQAMCAEISNALPPPPVPSQVPSSGATTATGITAPSTAGAAATGSSWWAGFTFVGSAVKDDFRESIILDSGSSIDLFCNRDLLQDVGPVTFP